MKRHIHIIKSSDLRSSNPGKNYGVRSATLILGISNNAKTKAVHIEIDTGAVIKPIRDTCSIRSYPFELGSIFKHEVDNLEGCSECLLLGPEQKCGQTYLIHPNADEVIEGLLAEGTDYVWRVLEEIYMREFHDGPQPNTDFEYEVHPNKSK